MAKTREHSCQKNKVEMEDEQRHKSPKPARSWREISDRLMSDLRVHSGFRDGGD